MRQPGSLGKMGVCGIGVALAGVLGCGEAGRDTTSPSAQNCSEAGADDASSAGEAGIDSGPELPEAGACPGLLFSEDFEGFSAGAAIDATWQTIVEGPNSSARINLDNEGHGNAGSNRFAIFTNAGSEPNPVNISAARGPFDVRGCQSATLSASVIVFSLEQTENDHAFVEVRGNGGDWILLYMPFPSPDFASDANCRAGGQETGCVAWKTIQVTLPRVAIGPNLQVRFRMLSLTAVTDFFGFDDVSLSGVP